jgi:hypothetical protein
VILPVYKIFEFARLADLAAQVEHELHPNKGKKEFLI